MKFLLLLLSLNGSAIGQALVIDADPARSSVQFKLGDVLHTVHGTFKVRSGSLRVNPADGKAGGQVVVDVRSGDTGGGMRDRRMHKDVLQSEQFPDAVFSPDRVTGSLLPEGVSKVSIHGVLRIHGQDHEVTLPAEVTAHGDQVTATATFDMPYENWGMKNPSSFLLKVNGTVALTMTVQGQVVRR